MPRHALTCHPDTPCAAIERVEAEIHADEHGATRLTYRLLGDARRIRAASAAAAPRRRDELWRGTCCELFVRDPVGGGYAEYNFAPCGDWAAYRFDDYRAGCVAVDASIPRIVLERTPSVLELNVTLRDLPLITLDQRRIGIACIVETATELSYWALAHPRGRPDFHHVRAFAVTLAVTAREPASARTA